MSVPKKRVMPGWSSQFAIVIKTLREAKEWSIRKAARRLGISLTYLITLERGDKGTASLELIRRMSEVYEIPEDHLIYASGKIHPDIARAWMRRPDKVLAYCRLV